MISVRLTFVPVYLASIERKVQVESSVSPWISYPRTAKCGVALVLTAALALVAAVAAGVSAGLAVCESAARAGEKLRPSRPTNTSIPALSRPTARAFATNLFLVINLIIGNWRSLRIHHARPDGRTALAMFDGSIGQRAFTMRRKRRKKMAASPLTKTLRGKPLVLTRD